MTQRKSEDREVPDGHRKGTKTRGVESHGGGKAIPVKVAEGQLTLFFATAGNLPGGRAEGEGGAGRPTPRAQKVPKAKSRRKRAVPARVEEVVGGLDEAFENVAKNKGAPGPDGETVELVREHWEEISRKLRTELTAGTYQPGDIRRVWIPKSSGGQRGLGIPNVVDRVIQEAVRQVLEPVYEPTFHPSVHGFRPNRSCHTAMAEARGYVAEGYGWVVDLDLEKFFDRVHHQRLLGRLAKRVSDGRLLALVGRMLKAKVILPEGVRVSTEEGVPQGGPLSPLLSNIVLSELDEELARRGHRFVRYADDANIYVRSERAGKRVMESVKAFIQRRLRLTVNADKSAVARPETRHFLGFRLVPGGKGEVETLLSERSHKRLREKIRELTPRNAGESLSATIRKVNVYLVGWSGYFGICTEGTEKVLQNADAHLRRRLRAVVLKHWKTKRTVAHRLVRLGVTRKTAWRNVYKGRQSTWALSHSPAVDRGLRNAYFAERGLESLWDRFRAIWTKPLVPVQLELPLGAERS